MPKLRINAMQRAHESRQLEMPSAVEMLDDELGCPETFGQAIAALRRLEGASLTAFAKRLGVSSQHLSDIEHETRYVSAERASEWAERLGRPRELLVRLALQRLVDALGLRVKVEAA